MYGGSIPDTAIVDVNGLVNQHRTAGGAQGGNGVSPTSLRITELFELHFHCQTTTIAITSHRRQLIR